MRDSRVRMTSRSAGSSFPDPQAVLTLRNIDNGFADSNELLRQQGTDTARTLHRPHSRLERRGPIQQPVALAPIRTHRELCNDPFFVIDHRCGVRPLMRIDTNDEHEQPPRDNKRRGGHS